jgi:hypothetical protein
MQRSRIRFTPVQLKARHDGWTAERQRRFIDELAATRSLTRACQAVGMTRTAAYKLRDRPDALHFRLAWCAALEADIGQDRRRAKVGKVEEMEGVPNSLNHAPTSSTWETLQTYLALLRAQDERLGSAHGG